MPYVLFQVARCAGRCCLLVLLLAGVFGARAARAQVVVRERVEVAAPRAPDVVPTTDSGGSTVGSSVDRRFDAGLNVQYSRLDARERGTLKITSSYASAYYREDGEPSAPNGVVQVLQNGVPVTFAGGFSRTSRNQTWACISDIYTGSGTYELAVEPGDRITFTYEVGGLTIGGLVEPNAPGGLRRGLSFQGPSTNCGGARLTVGFDLSFEPAPVAGFEAKIVGRSEENGKPALLYSQGDEATPRCTRATSTGRAARSSCRATPRRA